MSDEKRPEIPLQIVDRGPEANPRGSTVPPVHLSAEDDRWPGIRSYIDTIVGGWAWIALAIGGALVIAGCYLFVATPTYKGEALVQVEQRSRGPGNFDDLSGIFDTSSASGAAAETETETEIEILRSRTLVGQAVDELHLDVVARPLYAPLLGRPIAARHSGTGLAEPVFGLARYAWGGERIGIDRFDVPAGQENEDFTLVARGGGHFDLRDPDGRPVLSGEVGKVAAAALAPESQAVAIFVSALVAREGTQFRVQRQSRGDVVDELLKTSSATEKGDKAKKTGIIRLTMEGSDPAVLAATLDNIADNYLRRNIQRKSAEAEKTLEFINRQLPQLQVNLKAAQQAFSDHQAKHGSIDISVGTRTELDRIVALERELTVVEMQSAEAKQRFTENHPVMAAMAQKLARLRAEREQAGSRLRALPGAEVEAARLTLNVKVASELYALLMKKAQEIELVKSRGATGNVVILDRAFVSRKPVNPTPGKTLGLGLFLGATLGIGGVLLRRSLSDGVDDPSLLEREIGLPVYASIPHSAAQDEVARSDRSGSKARLLAAAHPTELAVESLRSLRTSVQFALTEARNNVVAIVGPSPSIGKSFVSMNLAYVMADTGMRVLLVDGDMRNGHLHRHFGGEKDPGLVQIIQGTIKDSAAIRKTSSANLFFLSSGGVPANPSELLLSMRFQAFIERASREYDIVVIDTPPLLAVTDPILIGRLAGTNLIVLSAGKHPMREVALSVNRMLQNGVQPHALVVNDVKPRTGASRYGYHYQYDYT